MPPPASKAQTLSPSCQDEPGPTSLITPEHSRPEHLAGPRRRRIQARFLQQIGAIETCRSDSNANLSYITCRTRLFYPLHLTFNALQCFHSASIVSLD